MNPIYKFELVAGNITKRVYPIYKDDLAKEFSKESNQEFFRAKLSGKLTFESEDYTFIVTKAFDTQFLLRISISYNAGQTWAIYWRGTFWKTDCEFDEDTQMVVVQPSVYDQYNDVLAGMDKEYNLIDLAPEIVQVKADKRPLIQVYVPGQSVVGCFLSGMWWEQECEVTSESDTVEVEGQTVNKLAYLCFALNKVMTMAEVSGTPSLQLPEFFSRTTPASGRFNPRLQGRTEFAGSSTYKLVYTFGAGSTGSLFSWSIIRISDDAELWRYSESNQLPPELPVQLTLTPVSGSGVTGDVILYVHDFPVYARYICDTLTIRGNNTVPIPADDIVENNRNYTRMIRYEFPETIYFSTRLTTTPNQWGLYQPGQYYGQPNMPGYELFPISRNAWGRVSIWFSFTTYNWVVEASGRQPFIIRHAYPLSSVLSVLLAQIAPGITHAATTDYSQFLYGETNIIGITQTLLITPKSNIISAGYDQPAQKAPITLKDVLDMLRDCFRCYWFVDDQNRFRVEHIQYFRNGGSYSDAPEVGIDLTTQEVTRSGKKWAFARNQYKFDKPNMAARYQFGWMDDVTQLFEGYPIEILSKYVNPDNIEQIDVAKFTSDIDYILLNPGEISKDGFVLLAAAYQNILPETEVLTLDSSGRAEFDVDGSAYAGMTARVRLKLSAGVVYGYQYDGHAYTGFGVTINTNTQYVDIVIVPNLQKIVFNYGTAGATVTVYSITPQQLALPYYNYVHDYNDHYLQNAYVAFMVLQQYYAYDMPAPNYSINGEQYVAQGTKKLRNQTIRFPALTDPDLMELVKTNLGNGVIEKLSVNLSSRNANATLMYDTE